MRLYDPHQRNGIFLSRMWGLFAKHRPAFFTVRWYGEIGNGIGNSLTAVGALRDHTATAFRAVLRRVRVN
jgi:hypothetical protein